MRKISYVMGLAILAAALAVLPGAAQAEMYLEGYMGIVGASNSSTTLTFGRPESVVNNAASIGVPGRYDNPFFQGGLKVGTWFVKEGFLGANYPDWMKYLGFYIDFSYHNLTQRNQSATFVTRNAAGAITYTAPSPANPVTPTFSSEGTCATLAFMFAGRYGFLQDSEVPFGRLQPYVAVGPAILFATQEPKFADPNIGYGIKPSGSASTAVICLAVEGGVRYMALKNVSLDLSFKYRYAAPSFTYDFTDAFSGLAHSFTYKQTYNLFSGQLGVAYHF
jgi:opacity protein-like surface antigen